MSARGFGTGPFGRMPFGGGDAPPPSGRVYARVLYDPAKATIAPTVAAATLAPSPRGFAALTAAAGFATLQTD